MIEFWTMAGPVLSVVALIVAFILLVKVKALPAGNARMVAISEQIREGSMAFLNREFKLLGVFSIVMFVVLYFALGVATAASFLLGAFLSMTAGYIGMNSATAANTRTAEAARTSGKGAALIAAFDGGAVMGLCVAGLGLLGMGLLHMFYADSGHFTHIIHGFGAGASSIALFARIGGGIYTKAADVGADLAGKVIAGIPEDDPRNPGVIADNVGDNVGDVAGMGADIFESFAAASIAAIAIAATSPDAFLQTLVAAGGSMDLSTLRQFGILLPLVLATIGLAVSLFSIIIFRFFKNSKPAVALRFCLLLPPVAFIVIAAVVVNSFGLTSGITWALAAGAIGGGIIGLLTDYYTSAGPVMKIAKASQSGGAGTNVIAGLAVGLECDLCDLRDRSCCWCGTSLPRTIRNCTCSGFYAFCDGDGHDD